MEYQTSDMKSGDRFRPTKRLFSVKFIIFHIILCKAVLIPLSSANTGSSFQELIIGQWETADKSVTINFFEDGTYTIPDSSVNVNCHLSELPDEIKGLHLMGSEGTWRISKNRLSVSMDIGGFKNSTISRINETELVLEHGNYPPVHFNRLSVYEKSICENDEQSAESTEPFKTDSWESILLETIKDTSQIRVRTEGTCHYDPNQVKTLFEITDKEQIENIISSIEIDETRSGFHCMCCGSPTIEFYKGTDLLAMLGSHHGISLRWAGGKWEGDALLTEKSADSLANWLAQNGVKEPLEELKEQRNQERAAKLRYEKYLQILGPKLAESFQSSQSANDFTTAIQTLYPKETDQASLYLKLFGCDYGSWNLYSLLDEFLVEQLDSKTPATLWEAMSKAETTEGIRGASRWIIIECKNLDIYEDKIENLSGQICKVGLTHPRRINRERTIAFLSQLKSEKSLEILQNCLNDKYKILPLPDEETIEPGGMIMFWPRDERLTDECSEKAYAALVLAERGDKSALPVIKSILEFSPDNDRAVYTKAISILEQQD